MTIYVSSGHILSCSVRLNEHGLLYTKDGDETQNVSNLCLISFAMTDRASTPSDRTIQTVLDLLSGLPVL